MHFAAASILICRLEKKCGISFGVILRSVVARKNLPILPTANSFADFQCRRLSLAKRPTVRLNSDYARL